MGVNPLAATVSDLGGGQSDAINIKSNHEQKSNNMLFDFWGQLGDLKGNLKAILDHLGAIGGLSWGHHGSFLAPTCTG